MAKSVIIIGAGIAGLAAGCYAQMNGFKSKMFEMHNKPGGLCTAWKRKGYTFDLCVHWITGSSPKSNVYDIWEELGIVQGRDFITHEYGIKVIDEEGNEFVTYTNPDKLQEEMLTFSKEDEKLIKNFTKDIKKLGSMDLPIDMGFLDILRMLPSLRLWKKYSLPLSEMAAKFKNPTLRKLFEMAFYWHDQTTAFCTMEIAQMGGGYSGYPIGGSLPVAKAIEQRYLDLGGEISYKSQVKRILVEENRAVGIELSDGTKERGDIIISAADGHSTIFNWLNGEYIDDKIRSFYDSLELFPPIVFISLGVNQDYSHEPHVLSFSLKKPITITGNEIDHIVLRNHSFDPTLAPEGKTAFTIILETNYDYWVGLNDEEYLAEKKNIEESVISALLELYLDIKEQIEVVDVATPLTFVRYTGNWKGSYEGWLFTKKTNTLQMPQTLPGLSNFYMAGQWVSPGGGLFGAATSAHRAVKMICKNEKIHFKTTKP